MSSNKNIDIEAAKFGVIHQSGGRLGIEVLIKFTGIEHKDKRFNAFRFLIEEEIDKEMAEQLADMMPVSGQMIELDGTEEMAFFAKWTMNRKGLEAAIWGNESEGGLAKYSLVKLMRLGAIDKAIKKDGQLSEA